MKEMRTVIFVLLCLATQLTSAQVHQTLTPIGVVINETLEINWGVINSDWLSATISKDGGVIATYVHPGLNWTISTGAHVDSINNNGDITIDAALESDIDLFNMVVIGSNGNLIHYIEQCVVEDLKAKVFGTVALTWKALDMKCASKAFITNPAGIMVITYDNVWEVLPAFPNAEWNDGALIMKNLQVADFGVYALMVYSYKKVILSTVTPTPPNNCNDTEANINDTITLTWNEINVECSSKAFIIGPDGNMVATYNNGWLVTQTNKYTLLETGALTIGNLQIPDFGVYALMVLSHKNIIMRTFKAVDCYKDSRYSRLLPSLLFSERNNVDWLNWKAYSCTLIERCGAAAQERGHKYFGLEFIGECWSGNTLSPRPLSNDTIDENWGTTGDCLIGRSMTICVYICE